jgi:hypothetical protein
MTDFTTLPHGPGRIYKPDARDRKFPLRTLRAATEKTLATIREATGGNGLPFVKYWHSQSYFADQGATGMCVAYAGLNWFHDGPITHKVKPPFMPADVLYQQTRLADGFDVDMTLQEGSTTRGICEFLRKIGAVDSYHWASFDDPQAATHDVVFALRALGPVFFGTDWTEGMMEPDGDRIIRPTGAVIGGHEVVLNGVNLHRGLVRYECAWDAEKAYFGYMRIDDLPQLFAGIEYPADAAFAMENRYFKADAVFGE